MPGLMDGWQPTVTPTPQAAPPQASPSGGGGLLGFGDKLGNALSSPLFQFGMGMMGAGSEGKGLGGGLFAGAQAVPNAWKMMQQQRQMKFQQDMNDPSSQTYKLLAQSLSPGALAAASANPALLQTLFAHKGDLETQKAIAGINANAQVSARIRELQFMRQQAKDAMSQFGPLGGASPQPAAGAAPAIGTVEGGYRFKGGDPSNQASWELAQ